MVKQTSRYDLGGSRKEAQTAHAMRSIEMLTTCWYFNHERAEMVPILEMG